MRIAYVIGLLAIAATCAGQRPDRPYGAQLKTDPDAGNLLGIQRYGRRLRTDPDQGSGFAFHVFPVARTGVAVTGGTQPDTSPDTRRSSQGEQPFIFRGLTAEQQDKFEQALSDLRIAADDAERQVASEALQRLLQETSQERMETPPAEVRPERSAEDERRSTDNRFRAMSGGTAGNVVVGGEFGLTPFNATAGIRSYMPPSGPPAFQGEEAFLAQRGLVVSRPGKQVAGLTTGQIYPQPLIQIKARIVEVLRDDTLQARSVIDYISHEGDQNPLFTGNNVNENRNRTTGTTRFPTQSGLIGPGASSMLGGVNGVTGTGLLINATSEHINYIASLLATEFSADVITAPEVVTLNGQNVEFLAGEKLPFPIGQNVINQTSSSVQQVFYKHVGSYISVTPTIINWGRYGEGRGKAVLNAADIPDWTALVRAMLEENNAKIIFAEDSGGLKAELEKLLPGALPEAQPELLPLTEANPAAFLEIVYQEDDTALVPEAVEAGELVLPPEEPMAAPAESVIMESTVPDIVVPIAMRTKILDHLNAIPREVLISRGFPIALPARGCENGCDWSPQDCTIDLVVAIRLSDAFMGNITVNTGDQAVTLPTANSEMDVTAIANVVQVKSGHGVVMAGLIGERDVELVRKVPVLGDVPVVGAAFRTKTTNRQKSEVLIFLEAKVLDPTPECARAESHQDFTLGTPYVVGEFLDNPLEYGMYRAGFGSYLPPHSHDEAIYWERLGRKIRKAATEADDIFE